MLNTSYSQIVNTAKIGTYEKVDLNEVVEFGLEENVTPSHSDRHKVLFLGIDIQNDFMEEGSLGVPGAHKDVEQITKFLYDNLGQITEIAVSLDTHELNQIFHPSWWVNQEGEHPEPLTIITSNDIEQGKWKPVKEQDASIDYVRHLEKLGQKNLCIWPYHCIEGTPGATLESQFSKMIHYHSTVRQTRIKKVVKGQDPLSEMYGIIKPEYSQSVRTNEGLLNYIRQFDQVIIAGEAESHCVYESVKQIAEHFSNDLKWTQNIYVLKDGMSCIPGFEEENEKAWKALVNNYGIQLVESTDLKL
ncbi:hypothetical protein [Piscibacillus halophilus]|uniref:Nicotinamidase-related amidase n=1 Tax=Piscibacillus halophilus TaxID=571933 RepID=A0A1H9L1S6_9BACI|nr:hypothetical protein [Piscibacillus halophilus]SER05422.1 Nicotinamidase-related amidase [Piscibacillus halophilus]